MAAQKLEKTESAPGNGIAPKGSSPQDLKPACQPLVSPAAAKPSGARRVSLRMTLNGVRGLLEAGSVSDDVVARKGNFPPRKPLISHETGKELAPPFGSATASARAREGAFAGSGDIRTSAILADHAIPRHIRRGSSRLRALPLTKTAGPDVFSASF